MKKIKFYPKAVCVFCENCIDYGCGHLRHFCKIHPSVETIHPIKGTKCKAFCRELEKEELEAEKNKTKFSDSSFEDSKKHYGIDYDYGLDYLPCCLYNFDGNCPDFSKIDSNKAKELSLSTGKEKI